MKHLYLIRHGQTDGNKAGLWIGARSQYKLNSDGRIEASIAGSKLRELELNSYVIYASPVERAFQTAKIIQTKISLPIVPVPELSEMFFGDLEGIDEEKYKSEFKFVHEQWLKSCIDFHPPNGESGKRFLERAVRTIETLSIEAESSEIIIVTHSGIIKMFLAYISGANLNVGWRRLNVPEVTTGGIVKIQMHDGKYRFLETIGGGIDG
jgi:broad specificity phosphatase PhoE